MTSHSSRTAAPSPHGIDRYPQRRPRSLAMALTVALVASVAASSPAAAHGAPPAKPRPASGRICHHLHQRHCIPVPSGVGRPHRNQDTASGPRLALAEPADGLGADQSGTQGAVDWAYQLLGSHDYDGWCGKFVAHAFGRAALGYSYAWQAGAAFGLSPGSPPPGSLVFFRRDRSNGSAGHVGIALPGNRMISAQSDGVRIANLSAPYWRALYWGWALPPSSWPGRAPNGASPPLFPAPATPAPAAPPPPTPPAPVTSAAPAPAATAPVVNRQQITSYDRLSGGAPHSGFFDVAWQPFTAASNTLTAVGVNVGNPNRAPGQPAPETIVVRVCSAQPDVNGACPGQIAQATPQIINYGASVADIGDAAVNPGQTYWIAWYQPAPAGGATWETYWWAGGSTISSSDQMATFVRGYNR